MHLVLGAGPCGIALAWYLTLQGKQVVLVEKEPQIGGCHRVTRVNGYFTEHGPRVYLGNYIQTNQMLNEMGMSWGSVFRADSASFTSMSLDLLKELSIDDLFKLVSKYFEYLFVPEVGTVAEAVKGLSDSGRDIIDRICLMTDGAPASKYTFAQFFEMINTSALYRIYRLNEPSDQYLFPKIHHALVSKGVKIHTNTIATLNISGNRVSSAIVGDQEYKVDQLYAALPPKVWLKYISVWVSAPRNSWVSAREHDYNVYVSITFHWPNKVDVSSPDAWPRGEWAIEWSQVYNDSKSQTIISAAISRLDVKSKFTGQSANETPNANDLIAETWRQMGLKNVDPYSYAIVSPCNFYENGKWSDHNTAYVKTLGETINWSPWTNAKNVGTQNLNSTIPFTSMESAIQNARAELGFTNGRPFSILEVVILVLVFVVIIVIINIFF